jgi:sialic acid synthase SpsE
MNPRATLPQSIEIGGRRVGPGHPIYIIAEAGSNHDQNLEKALALVDAAAEAGCDAVKFQTFNAEEIASEWQSPQTALPKEFGRWWKNLKELYRSCALPDNFHEPLWRRAKERGIAIFSSPFSETAVERLARLGVPALKIASFELVHLPLIRQAARTGVPLILSTGMADLGDIERALSAAVQAGAQQVALLHCGSNYPLEPSSVHLAAMDMLRQAFGVPVGYSDHTLDIAVPIAVAARGGNLLEKHFTLSRKGSGPDHSFAVEPGELSIMVKHMRTAQAAIGESYKRRQPEEAAHAIRGRRSVFAATDLAVGDLLTAEKIKILRPGVGLEPSALELVLGRRIRRAVKAGAPIAWDDLLGERA